MYLSYPSLRTIDGFDILNSLEKATVNAKYRRMLL